MEADMSKVALVTGGTRGIGRAIVKRLKEAGCTVAATYASNEAAAQCCAHDLGVAVIQADAACFEACQGAVAQVEDRFGPVDVLVNNAEITRDGPFHRMTSEQWSAVMRVDMDSLFNMTRPVIEGMRQRGWGRVVNISSINGQKGQTGQTNYCAAKAGAIGFTKALAQENAKKGVTVNCICPGYVDTEMVRAVPAPILQGIIDQIPVGRLGQGEEVAELVAFLVSDQAAFLTGATVAVNGGQYMVG